MRAALHFRVVVEVEVAEPARAGAALSLVLSDALTQLAAEGVIRGAEPVVMSLTRPDQPGRRKA